MSMFMNNRPVQKVVLKNTTRLSLHERFTYLRNNVAEASTSTSGNVLQRQRELQRQTARSRRIAMQMERRPAVIAALRLKKRSLGQRIGSASSNMYGLSVKDRLSLGRRGKRIGGFGANVRNPNRPSLQQSSFEGIRRSRSRGRGPSGVGAARGLSRTQSMQSVNSVGRFTSRGRSRSRSRSRVGMNMFTDANNQNGQRSGSRVQRGNERFLQQKQRGRLGGGAGSFRGRSGTRGRVDGRNRGGGGGRRGGRGVRGRRGQNAPVPTREELDNQLDQYMANSRYGLDKDLDAYMKQATNLGSTSSGTAMQVEESWD